MRINDHTDAKTNSTTTKHIGWGEEGGVVGMYATGHVSRAKKPRVNITVGRWTEMCVYVAVI